MKTKTIETAIRIPEPYDLQWQIIRSQAKRKVICAGRRAGKTTVAAQDAVQKILDGKRVLIGSATQDQADAFWDKLTSWLHPLIEAGVMTRNKSRRIISYGETGRIRIKTYSEPDSLRGDDADLIIFDECALLDPDAWYKVGAPMLADRDGDAMFISTPRRKNWFYRLYQKAIDPHEERWAHWTFPSHANPHISSEALKELSSEMPQDDYRQEILAEFLENQGAVFRKVRDAVKSPILDGVYFGNFVMGVDWAQQRDFTVLTIMDTDTNQLVAIDRFNGVDWALQRGRLVALFDLWQPGVIIAEANSIGSPNIEALQREELPIVSFMTTAKSKPPLIESLILAFERGDIGILDDQVLIGELEAYERRVLSSGYSQYNAPQGMHDDCVISLALAWHGCASSGFGFVDLLDSIAAVLG